MNSSGYMENGEFWTFSHVCRIFCALSLPRPFYRTAMPPFAVHFVFVINLRQCGNCPTSVCSNAPPPCGDDLSSDADKIVVFHAVTCQLIYSWHHH